MVIIALMFKRRHNLVLQSYLNNDFITFKGQKHKSSAYNEARIDTETGPNPARKAGQDLQLWLDQMT